MSIFDPVYTQTAQPNERERQRPVEKQGHEFYDPEQLQDAYQVLAQMHPRYNNLQLLQQTYNSIVFTAINSQSQEVAVKMLDVRKINNEPNPEKREKIPKWMAREVLYHSYMDHPCIIKFRDSYYQPPFLCMEMEYAAEGNLLQHLNKHKPISEDESRVWFQQLIYAVNYVHKTGIANRDIKLENCLLVSDPNHPQKQPMLKLADFGYAKSINQEVESLHTSQVGTLPYYSPDVWKLAPGQAYDGRKCDVWSCGICLYVLLTGKYPFEPRMPLLELKRAVCRAEFDIPANKVSTQAYDLIKKLLDPDPETRYTIPQVIKHDWFQIGLSTQNVIKKEPSVMDLQRRNQIIEHVKSVINHAIPDLLSRRGSGNSSHLRVFQPSTVVLSGSGAIPIEIDEQSREQILKSLFEQQRERYQL